MAPPLSKFSVCYKDCQSGKTFEQFLRVRKQMQEGKKYFYIFFTDNFKLQSSQLNKRFQDEFPDKGLPIQLNSGFKYSTKQRREIPVAEQNCAEYHDVANILLDCPNRDTLMVLSNSFRAEDLIKNLNKWFRAGGYDGVQVWFDEIDRTTSLFSETIPALNEHPNVVGIVGMTGTGLQHLFNHLRVRELSLLPVSLPHENFMGFNEHQFRNVEMDLDDTKLFSALDEYTGYAAKVLAKEKFVKPGVCAFIPAHPWCSKQRTMSHLLMAHGFDVVAVVNGEDESIYRKTSTPSFTPSDFDSLLEIVNDDAKWMARWSELEAGVKSAYDHFPIKGDGETLAFSLGKLSRENNWKNLSVAVTGHKCITRGVTIQSQDFVLTHAIIPLPFNMNDSALEEKNARKRADNFYQLCARINGNTREWNGDNGVKVYTSAESQAFLQGYCSIPQNLAHLCANGVVTGQQYADLLSSVFKYVDDVSSRIRPERNGKSKGDNEPQTTWRYNVMLDSKEFQEKVGISLNAFCTKPSQHFKTFLDAFGLVSDSRGPNARKQIEGHFTGSTTKREGILTVPDVVEAWRHIPETSTSLFQTDQISGVRQEDAINKVHNKCAVRMAPCYWKKDGPVHIGMCIIVSGVCSALENYVMA